MHVVLAAVRLTGQPGLLRSKKPHSSGDQLNRAYGGELSPSTSSLNPGELRTLKSIAASNAGN